MCAAWPRSRPLRWSDALHDFGIQFSKSIFLSERNAPPFLRFLLSAFLLQETNDVFAFFPTDRRYLAPSIAVDGCCRGDLRPAAAVVARSGCPLGSSAAARAGSGPAAGGSFAGLLEAALGLPTFPATLPAAAGSAAEHGQLPAHRLPHARRQDLSFH